MINNKTNNNRDKLGKFIKGHVSLTKGKKLNIDLGNINCKLCGKKIIKTGGMKKYCHACIKIKNIEKARKYEMKNPLKMKEWADKSQKKRRLKYPERFNIYTKTNRKIMTKPTCEICNSTENLQKHHWRYDKPLLVNTLCKECHSIQHVKNFYENRFGGNLQCHI